MFQTLTFYHSVTRWFVLLSLLYAVYSAASGYFSGRIFSKRDNALRHWTATIAHIQLTIGIVLYVQSPVVKYFWKNFSTAVRIPDIAFFGLFHMLLMLTAIVLITVGSAMAKRKPSDREKFRTMLAWFSIALFIILLAIPWPFYPFAGRPYLR